MDIKTIRNLTIDEANLMTEKELRETVGKLAKSANAKMKRLKAAGIETPASRSAEASGGKFTTKGKNRNQLLKEFSRAQNFEKAKTSTIKGAAKVKADFEKRVNEDLPDEQKLELTDDETKTFWNVYNQVYKEFPDLVRNYDSTQIQKMIRTRMIRGGTFEEIFADISDRLLKDYEDGQNEQTDFENDDLELYDDYF